MEIMVSIFLNSIYIILPLIFVFAFVLPLARSITRKKKKDNVLNKYSIFLDSDSSRSIITMLIMALILFVMFVVLYISLKKYEINPTGSIGGIVFSLIVIILSCVCIVCALKKAMRTLKGEYIIVLDELVEIQYNTNRNQDGEPYYDWKLYFKDYFKLYNDTIEFRTYLKDNRYNKMNYFELYKDKMNIKKLISDPQCKYKKGEKFYLVFIKGNKKPYMFSCKEYSLDSTENEKIQTIDKVKEYINRKEFVLKKEIPNEKIEINKEKIKGDFKRLGHIKTAIFLAGATVVSIIILISCLNREQTQAAVMASIFIVFMIIVSGIKIKYIFEICKNIDKGDYKIKEDEIVSLNNGMDFSDSNEKISFKFKNYKKIVYQDKKYFADVKIGDKLYLIFVKGDKEPIVVYDCKNSYIGEK